MGAKTGHEMRERIKNAGHGGDRRSLSGPASFFQRRVRPVRLAVMGASLVIAFLLGALFVRYGSKLYEDWRQDRLFHRAAALLQQGRLNEASDTAQELLGRHPDSLPALYILAEAAEKENLEETVSRREQIARLLPKDADSQLNLASAALRFGKLDLAREALDRVAPTDRDRAAFHVVAGWLARAEGNLAEQEEQFAAAVKKEPTNDLYQFNLAALRIRSSDVAKSAKARDTLQRLSKVAPYRTGVLRALLNDAVERNDLGAADNFAQQLQMSPEVTFGDYLLCLNFYRKLDEKKFRLLLDKVKPFAARNFNDLASLMEWMNQNGLAGDVVKWIDKLPAAELNSPPAAVAVADAYATAKNWSRLKRWTHTPATSEWGDSKYLRLAYQAIATRQSQSRSGGVQGPANQNMPAVGYDRLVKRSVLRPREAMSQIIRLDQANLAASLAGTPMPAWQLFFSVFTKALPMRHQSQRTLPDLASTLSKILNARINWQGKRTITPLTRSTAL